MGVSAFHLFHSQSLRYTLTGEYCPLIYAIAKLFNFKHYVHGTKKNQIPFNES